MDYNYYDFDGLGGNGYSIRTSSLVGAQAMGRVVELERWQKLAAALNVSRTPCKGSGMPRIASCRRVCLPTTRATLGARGCRGVQERRDLLALPRLGSGHDQPARSVPE